VCENRKCAVTFYVRANIKERRTEGRTKFLIGALLPASQEDLKKLVLSLLYENLVTEHEYRFREGLLLLQSNALMAG
jgi:hypothetical protein